MNTLTQTKCKILRVSSITIMVAVLLSLLSILKLLNMSKEVKMQIKKILLSLK